ncbi:hypothetical protein SRABI27_00317 [Pedobacter sp. Bi27]|nr:hypothetical protein SRABI27_00317 [Pedobacter sp. Bi27]
MSNWLSKSTSSLKASQLLCDDFSNQSVHCAYYSCVQFIYHLMNTQMNETEEDLNEGITKQNFENSLPLKKNGETVKLGTHVWLQKELYRSLRSKTKDFKMIQDITDSIGTISEVRILADYTNEIILEPRAKGIVKKAESLIESLDKIY